VLPLKKSFFRTFIYFALSVKGFIFNCSSNKKSEKWFFEDLCKKAKNGLAPACKFSNLVCAILFTSTLNMKAVVLFHFKLTDTSRNSQNNL